MGILRTGKIQSHGEAVGERYVKVLWFEQINSGASGTLSPPSQGEIQLDQWAAGVDALASTISDGVPTFISPATSGGTIITATLDTSGNWTLSGTPSSYPIAIIYVYKVKLKFFDSTKQLGDYELIPSAGGVFTDVTNFNGRLSSVDTTVQKALDTLDDHAHAGVYEPSDPTIQTHITGTGAPHTAAGVGADPAGTGHTEATAHVTVHENAYIHTDIALNTAARHAAISLAASADVLLGLSTQQLSLDTQAANLFLVGPASGGAAAPTFRAPVAADLGTGLAPTFAGLTVGSLAGFLFGTAGVVSALAASARIKVGSFTRSQATASGDQAVDGVGFKPAFLFFLANQSPSKEISWGFDDGTSRGCIVGYSAVDATNPFANNTSKSIFAVEGSGVEYSGVVSSLDADGFTITWTRTGAPTGNLVVFYVAFR